MTAVVRRRLRQRVLSRHGSAIRASSALTIDRLNNQDKVVALMSSLFGSEAIPDVRVRYWTDPAYRTAPGRSSRAEIFAGNGRTDAEVYRDLRFLPYFGYLLFGSELPDAAIEEFESELAGEGITPEWFTSGDHDPMWKMARRLTRRYGLEERRAAEEFLKLCLDGIRHRHGAQRSKRGDETPVRGRRGGRGSLGLLDERGEVSQARRVSGRGVCRRRHGGDRQDRR